MIEPENWLEVHRVIGYHFAIAGNSCLFYIFNHRREERNNTIEEIPFWQINFGERPSIYRNASQIDFDKYIGAREATREEFLEYLTANFPKQAEWFLFHPEWLR